jgi:hypothetical protein
MSLWREKKIEIEIKTNESNAKCTVCIPVGPVFEYSTEQNKYLIEKCTSFNGVWF